jgi:hypothetical protein
MIRIPPFIAFFTLILSVSVVQAADYTSRGYTPAPYVRELPFPRSDRAQAIWSEGSCWKQCQVACTNELNVCLQGRPAPFNIFTSNILQPAPAQAQCVAATDSCDRTCQSQCRGYGGPLLPPIPF